MSKICKGSANGVKKNMEIPGGWGGSTNYPLEWKFQGGGGVKTEEPSVGGVWIFSGITHFFTHTVMNFNER